MVWRMHEMPAEERKMAAVSFEATRGGGAVSLAAGQTGGGGQNAGEWRRGGAPISGQRETEGGRRRVIL